MKTNNRHILKTKNEDSLQAASILRKKKGITIEDNRQENTVQRKGNESGLPGNLKSGIEQLSGIAMDDVKVHYNSSEPAQLNAHAYAQGTDIHVSPGQEKYLPHEAWHVVQQKQGRVKPVFQMKGKVNINDDQGLEKEADVMGHKAIQVKLNHRNSLPAMLSKTPLYGVAQPAWIHDDMHHERWDSKIQGVQWFRNENGRLWFMDENADQRYKFWQGPYHSYTNEEWDRIEHDIATPEVMASEDTIGKIMKADLKDHPPIKLEGSRSKYAYLFNAAGEKTSNKSEGAFMIDPSMNQGEQANYRMVKSMGLRVPHIYGMHPKGAIVQFLPGQITVTGQLGKGGIADGVAGKIKSLRMLQRINRGAKPGEF